MGKRIGDGRAEVLFRAAAAWHSKREGHAEGLAPKTKMGTQDEKDGDDCQRLAG